jgi:chromosome segregation ATPase
MNPEQTKQLASWVSQRDLILVDISNLRTEQEKLTKTNLELAGSNTEIQNKIQQSVGRLQELYDREKDVVKNVSVELSGLRVEKTQLETKIEDLSKEIGFLTTHKNDLVELTDKLLTAHDVVTHNALSIDKVAGDAVKVNSDNVREIERLLATMKEELKKTIDVNEQNVSKTNVVINDLPRIIFDLQKDIAERKKFNKVKI